MFEPVKILEDPVIAGDWCVEWVNDDGLVELTIFSGLDARHRAYRYAHWRYRGSTNHPSGAGELGTRPDA